jgi:L-aminopeptidase/D-esterase-like protein
VQEGNVGAGAGATIGKLLGHQYAMKSGLGSASIKVGDTGVVVAAMVAVNAVGDIWDRHTGKVIAGARSTTPGGDGLAHTMDQLLTGKGMILPQAGTNTTIGIVATNAALTKDEATKVAQMAQDGYARAINPAHTPLDGDTIFALSTGTFKEKVWVGAVGAIAAVAMSRAVIRAVTQATGIPGFPAYADLQKPAQP